MFVLDGRTLALDVPFEHNGIQYPATWLRHVSPEERAAIGITEQAPPQFWDQRFYWGYDEDGELIEKDLEQLKAQWIGQVKQTAGSLLAQTDWAIVRAADPSSGKAVSNEVLAIRGTIRAKSDEKEVAIASASSVAQLASYVTSLSFNSWTEEGPAEEALIQAANEGLVNDGVTSGTMLTGDALYGGEGEDTLILG